MALRLGYRRRRVPAALSGVLLAAAGSLLPAAAWAQHDSDGRLDATMFWTGALIALTPLLLGGAVLAFVLVKRRKSAGGTSGGEQ